MDLIAREAAKLSAELVETAQKFSNAATNADWAQADKWARSAVDNVLLTLIEEESRPVGVYFIVLGLAMLVVFVSSFKATTLNGLGGLLAGLFAFPLSAIALFVCWRAIFRFMMETSLKMGCGKGASPAELLYCSTAAWQSHDVFVQAYVDVSSTSIGWQSSSQLLMFVLSGCTFLHIECRRRGLSGFVALCYIVVGFLGAISLAFPILFAHLFAVRGQIYGKTAALSLPLILCNLAAMGGVVLLPLTYESHRHSLYRSALLLVHFVLGLPAIIGRPGIVLQNAEVEKAKVAAFYAFLAGASLIAHIHNVSVAALELDGQGMSVEDIVTELFLGPFKVSTCQLSISFDVVFTSVACVAFMIASHPLRGLWCALLTPVLSISVTFPLFLCLETLSSF